MLQLFGAQEELLDCCRQHNFGLRLLSYFFSSFQSQTSHKKSKRRDRSNIYLADGFCLREESTSNENSETNTSVTKRECDAGFEHPLIVLTFLMKRSVAAKRAHVATE